MPAALCDHSKSLITCLALRIHSSQRVTRVTFWWLVHFGGGVDNSRYINEAEARVSTSTSEYDVYR